MPMPSKVFANILEFLSPSTLAVCFTPACRSPSRSRSSLNSSPYMLIEVMARNGHQKLLLITEV